MWARRVDELQQRSQRAIAFKLQQQREQIGAISARLESLSPLSVLSRGYSVTTKDGQALRSTNEVSVGDTISTKLDDGTAISRVEAISD